MDAPKNEKPLLILDLDETLFHSTESPDFGKPDFTLCEGKYHSYKRPGVDDFLRAVSEQWRLAVWTSASEDYADEAVGHLFDDPSELEFVWSFNRCTLFTPTSAGWYSAQESHYIKNLKKVKDKGFSPLERMLLVDDKPINAIRNYGNLIKIDRFDCQNPNDYALEMLAIYLGQIIDSPNLRTLDKRNWFMEALNSPSPLAP